LGGGCKDPTPTLRAASKPRGGQQPLGEEVNVQKARFGNYKRGRGRRDGKGASVTAEKKVGLTWGTRSRPGGKRTIRKKGQRG